MADHLTATIYQYHWVKVERYRLEAKRVFLQSQKISNADVKKAFLKIAHHYERMAEAIVQAPLI